MKKIITIICLLQALVPCIAQNRFVELDTIILYGIKIYDQGERLNPFSCQWQKSKNDEMFYSTPYEINSSGFGKTVYIAKDVEINGREGRYFLEKVNSGKLTLFYLSYKGKNFFIEKESSNLISIANKKSEFKEQLKEITEDCPEVADAVNFVRYNKKSMSHFVNRYEKCESRPFPHIRYGIKAGYEWNKIITPPFLEFHSEPYILKQFDYKYESVFSFGLFTDVPILMSDFSLNFSVNYSRNKYSYNNMMFDNYYEVFIKLSSLRMPVLLRYSLPTNKYRIFFQSGVIIEHNFNKESFTIKDNTLKEFEIDDTRFGYSLGTGCEYRITTRNFLFFEISFNQLYDIPHPVLYKTLKQRNILLSIGVNL